VEQPATTNAVVSKTVQTQQSNDLFDIISHASENAKVFVYDQGIFFRQTRSPLLVLQQEYMQFFVADRSIQKREFLLIQAGF
jgi:hypothetical protein